MECLIQYITSYVMYCIRHSMQNKQPQSCNAIMSLSCVSMRQILQGTSPAIDMSCSVVEVEARRICKREFWLAALDVSRELECDTQTEAQREHITEEAEQRR